MDGNGVKRFPCADLALELLADVADAGNDEAAVAHVVVSRGAAAIYDAGAPLASGMIVNAAGECLSFTHEDRRIASLEAPLWAWDRCQADDYESIQDYLSSRSAFHERYVRELERCSKLLGPPNAHGHDSDARGFSYALWNRGRALLCLFETDFDPQFGERIVLWVNFEKHGESPDRSQRFTDWLIPEEEQ